MTIFEYTYSPIKDQRIQRLDVAGAEDVAGVDVDRLMPAREIPHHPKQGSRPGLTYLHTTESHVQHESSLESHYLLEADFDRTVTDVACQPFRLVFDETSKESHTPDILLQHSDGSRTVVDVKHSKHLNKPGVPEQFAKTREFCDLVGWGYRVCMEPTKTRELNFRFLSGYRRAVPDLDVVAPHFLDAAAKPIEFGELVNSGSMNAGVHPAAGRVYAFTLLWAQVLRVDMDSVLDDSTVVLGGVA